LKGVTSVFKVSCNRAVIRIPNTHHSSALCVGKGFRHCKKSLQSLSKIILHRFRSKLWFKGDGCTSGMGWGQGPSQHTLWGAAAAGERCLLMYFCSFFSPSVCRRLFLRFSGRWHVHRWCGWCWWLWENQTCLQPAR